MSASATQPNSASVVTSQPEIEALVIRAQAGERSAQHSLYNRYAQAMFNVALRITKNEEDANDVLQEAFVNAFKYLGSFKGDATFGAWLKRIVVNTALHYQKKKKVDTVPLEDHHTGEDETQDDGPGIAFEDADGLTVEAIQAAVAQLPDGYRNVLTLYLFEGYDHEEVAEILAISVGTSKSQYNRAKAKLKQLLLEAGLDPRTN